MTVAADWRRLTKVLLGVSLIAAPLLIVLGEVIADPVYGGDNYAKYLASIEEHGTAYYAGNVAGAVGALFLLGAVVAMIHLVRVRHPKYAIGVGGLALLTVPMLSGMWMMSTVAEYQMANSPDQAAMARLLTEGEEAASAIPLMVVWIGMTLAVILLAAGLIWSRTVPVWMPALLIVAFLLLFVSDEGIMGVAVSAAILVALGGIGVTILRSSEEEWETGDLAGTRPPASSAPPPPEALPAH